MTAYNSTSDVHINQTFQVDPLDELLRQSMREMEDMREAERNRRWIASPPKFPSPQPGGPVLPRPFPRMRR